jgi:hypothetical protein
LTVAQQFTAGEMGNRETLSPVGTPEFAVSQPVFNRPYGTSFPPRKPSDKSLGSCQTAPPGRTICDLCATAMAFGPTTPRKRIRPASEARRGAMALLVLGALVVLLGVGSLALNLTWLTSHQVQLRQACEAAALAGAVQLLDPAPGISPSTSDPAAATRVALATEQARTFFAPNSSAVLQLTGINPDLVAGWREDPTMPRNPTTPQNPALPQDPALPQGYFTPWTGAGPVNSLLVRGVRRRSDGRAVTVWFGNFFGIGHAEPAAAAIASIDQRIYGFRPVDFVAVPMAPLLAPSTIQWPSGGPGTAGTLPDNYSVAPRTGAVTSGPDGVAEITLQTPGAGSWLALPTATTDFTLLATQVRDGLKSSDLSGMGGQLALGPDGTLLIPPAAAPVAAQTDALQAALLAIRGQKRIWPIGTLVTVGGQTLCQVTGFVAGCVVDCSGNANSLTIVVQACTIQTCTGLLRSGTTRNPWIGKLILNE